uniref:ubiquitinyl hydrolase 1 n=1 Tax=Emiliania huxleyi TaxID=2903 RepID=A0A6U8SKJ3_EMIHU|mmetsp:Transcript_15661/g.47419  ORF Transcript_15661/g.47419 Transcript_15661/m.47419 type:complete len:343 (+) Transcript_15661:116-1144(+)
MWDDVAAAAVDPDILSRRVRFVPARRASQPAATSALVRVLNPGVASTGKARSDVRNGDGGALPASQSAPAGPAPLFPPERLLGMLGWSSVRGAGPGLSNLGQTCFMNAALQALAHLPPLAQLCLSRHHSRGCRVLGWCAYCELEALIVELHGSAARSLAPTAMAGKLRLIARHFRPDRPQDAHEFLLGLLSRMRSAAAEGKCGGGGAADGVGGAEPKCCSSEVDQLFGGSLVSTLTCGVCGGSTTARESSAGLSLGLHKATTVERALRNFTASEPVKGDDSFWCAACAAKVEGTRRLRLGDTPHVLVLQLKRFRYDCARGASKLCHAVQYEEELRPRRDDPR